MDKKFLFLFFASFVLVKSDECGDDFFKCFSDFASSFFKNVSEVQHVNITEKVGGYEQVKDVGLETIEELTQSIQDELFKQIQTRVVNDAVIVTDNPKTKIYVKTFNHYFEDSFIPGFENIKLGSDGNEAKEVITANQAFAPFKANVVDVESGLKGINEQFAIHNQFHKDIVTLLNNNQEDNIKVTAAEDLKEQVKETTSSIDKNEPINTSIESTTSVEKSNNNKNNEEKEQINDDKVTMQRIDTIKEGGPVQKTESKNRQKGIKEESTQNLPDKISNTNNETSNTNNNEQVEYSSTKIFTEKQFEKDIRDNIIQTDEDYDIEDATDYPQIDYIDLYKDTTNEENVYEPTDKPKAVINIKDEIVENVEEYSMEIDTDMDNSTNICHGNTSDISNIYPWIAAIFIKNASSNQFVYSCDGALLSDRMLITAARCLVSDNTTVSPDDVLVFLGKTSLHSIGVDEKNVRVSQIIIHSNFSAEDGKVRNDLALLLLKEAAAFSSSIRPACLGDGPVEQSGTTAWHLSGTLTPVLFEKVENCNNENGGDGTLCATYGNAVTVCPSHGGLLASRRGGRWFLRGVSSDTRSRPGICLHRTLQYTALAEKLDWIMDYME